MLETLRQHGLAERTLVFFSSDNGPWLIMGDQGGSAGLLRDGKGSTWEGGMRVPGIAWWPGQVKPGVTSEVVCTMDLFSTSLALAGVLIPIGVTIDGRDMTSLLCHGTLLIEAPFYYYRGDTLAACRLGPWKAHFMTQPGYGPGKPESHDQPLLFHLGSDPSEKRNVAAENSEVVARIQAAVAIHRASVILGEPQLQ